jgi:hypothetical protein
MKLKTPQVAEFILETELNQIPLLDEINFRIQFAKDADNCLDTHLHIGFDSDSSSLRHQLEEDIYKNNFSFDGDDDFNRFTAKDIVEFYIKTLRRITSIAYLNQQIGDCFDKYLHPELTLLDDTLSALEEKYADAPEKLKVHDEYVMDKFAELETYENRLNQMVDQLSDFDINCFDRDINLHLHYAQQRLYPCPVDLLNCAAQTLLIIDIE